MGKIKRVKITVDLKTNVNLTSQNVIDIITEYLEEQFNYDDLVLSISHVMVEYPEEMRFEAKV